MRAQLADNHAIHQLLRRHLSGDWGDVSEVNAKANDHAVKWGGRVLSSYTVPSGERRWALTEADRSSTTVFTPGE